MLTPILLCRAITLPTRLVKALNLTRILVPPFSIEETTDEAGILLESLREPETEFLIPFAGMLQGLEFLQT